FGFCLLLFLFFSRPSPGSKCRRDRFREAKGLPCLPFSLCVPECPARYCSAHDRHAEFRSRWAEELRWSRRAFLNQDWQGSSVPPASTDTTSIQQHSVRSFWKFPAWSKM